MSRKSAGSAFVASDGNFYGVNADTNTVTLASIFNNTKRDVILSSTVTDENNITYTLTVVGGNESAGILPPTDYSISNKIRSIVLPDSVHTISSYAFGQPSAFSNNSSYLEYININMVTTLHAGALRGCSRLAGIYSNKDYASISFGNVSLPSNLIGLDGRYQLLNIYFNSAKSWPSSITVGGPVTATCVAYAGTPIISSFTTSSSTPAYRDTVTLTITHLTYSPLTVAGNNNIALYEIKKDGVLLSEIPSGRTYTINEFSPSDNGTYTVRLRDIFGFYTDEYNSSITITVNPETVLIISASSSTIGFGESVTLGISTENPPSGDLTYQWYTTEFDGYPIDDQTQTTLTRVGEDIGSITYYLSRSDGRQSNRVTITTGIRSLTLTCSPTNPAEGDSATLTVTPFISDAYLKVYLNNVEIAPTSIISNTDGTAAAISLTSVTSGSYTAKFYKSLYNEEILVGESNTLLIATTISPVNFANLTLPIGTSTPFVISGLSYSATAVEPTGSSSVLVSVGSVGGVTPPAITYSNIPPSISYIQVAVAPPARDGSGKMTMRINTVMKDSDGNLVHDFSSSGGITISFPCPASLLDGVTTPDFILYDIDDVTGAYTPIPTSNITYDSGTGLITATVQHFSGKAITNNGAAGGGVVCFPAGERVLTTTGYRSVEDLRRGDRLITADGRSVPAVVYRLSVPCATEKTAPYHIPAHTFGRNSPPADIRLSPQHAFQISKGLWQIPVVAAQTHSAIRQYGVGKPITYYHLELPNYFTDNIVMEGGAVVESFAYRQIPRGARVYTYNAARDAYTRPRNVKGIIHHSM